MVQVMLESWGGDCRQGQPPTDQTGAVRAIECYHVDARLSRDLDDLGQRLWAKVPRLLAYGLEAIGCRLRHGVKTFYYVPAPPRRGALYRDWLVMALCRPFFPRLVLHWHAAGLGTWLLNQAYPWERWISRCLLGRADLSIIQHPSNDPGLNFLAARQEEVIPCGIPDPGRDLASVIEQRRPRRFQARAPLFHGPALPARGQEADGDPATIHVLFMALCTRTKGLFDALEGVAQLQARLAAEGSPLQVRLTVAGKFWQEKERLEFDHRCAQPDLANRVHYAGFVSGEAKQRLFLEADIFCFPTYYESESFGLVLVEAMAYGLPIVTTRWRAIPDLFPAGYPGLVPPQAPGQVAEALLALLRTDSGQTQRAWFLQHHQLERHLSRLQSALLALD